MSIVWTLEEALDMCRNLNPKLKLTRFSLALAGGVLQNGHSSKDLDIVILPMHVPAIPEDWTRAKVVLMNFGFRLVRDREEVIARWRAGGSKDSKWVETWEYEGKRVDIFFLS